jgi:excisionase family DNA binding protein
MCAAMQLTLNEAAVRLGKSPRQVRYLIQTNRLPAHKLGRSWVLDSEKLELSPGQTQALDRRERQLRSAVKRALDLPTGEERPARYSVRDLKAFQLALPIHRLAAERLGGEHAATSALRCVLEHQGGRRIQSTESSWDLAMTCPGRGSGR